MSKRLNISVETDSLPQTEYSLSLHFVLFYNRGRQLISLSLCYQIIVFNFAVITNHKDYNRSLIFISSLYASNLRQDHIITAKTMQP